jgi:hypothetical protein
VIGGRLKWAAHIVQIDEQRRAKRILNAKPEGRRKRGKPKVRWEDGVIVMEMMMVVHIFYTKHEYSRCNEFVRNVRKVWDRYKF